MNILIKYLKKAAWGSRPGPMFWTSPQATNPHFGSPFSYNVLRTYEVLVYTCIRRAGTIFPFCYLPNPSCISWLIMPNKNQSEGCANTYWLPFFHKHWSFVTTLVWGSSPYFVNNPGDITFEELISKGTSPIKPRGLIFKRNHYFCNW